jgi:NADH dehydrogenase (ubiquinone) 1 alpha/beta subcomplex 1, acyl-carrier protein
MSSSIFFRSTIRSFRSVQPITRQIRPVPALVFRPAAPVFAQRHYASGSLGKDEVEKRIIEILKGFDKVTDPAKVCLQFAFGKGLGVHVLMED